MGEASLVKRLDGTGYRLEVVAATRLIAKRPNEDAHMVAHPLHMILRTLHHSIAELRFRRQSHIGVALHIGFCQHIHAVFVTQVVEHRVIRIVRCADGIDVQTLHGLDVLFNLLCRDGTSIHRREIVAVHTMEHHALAIDEERTIRTDAHLTEAHLAPTDINGLALLVLQGQHKVIEVGLLGIPLLRIRHIHVKAQFRCSFHSLRRLGNDSPVLLNLHIHCAALHVLYTRQAHLNVCLRIRVGGIKVSGEEVVTYLALRSSPQEAVTLNARESPIVLTLNERTACEAIHLQGDGVLPLGHIVRDIELRGQVRILAVAHTLAVHPKVVTMSHSIETHIHLPVLPVRRDGELTAIRAHRVGHVTLIGEPARALSHHTVRVLVVRERICHIAVQGLVPILVVVQPIHLPARRHIDVAPCSIVIVLLTHFRVHLAGVRHPVELPCAIQ